MGAFLIQTRIAIQPGDIRPLIPLPAAITSTGTKMIPVELP